MQMMPKPDDGQVSTFDPARLEVLRERLMIDKTAMAKILGVSRITYYDWVTKGSPMRKSNLFYVRSTLRKLVAVMRDNNWPDEATAKLSNHRRKLKLLELLEEYD